MPDKPSSTARLEAFSDGVIAVIITIMVLELKVPHQDGPAGLYAVLPILLIYLLSFTFTAIYWVNHQHLIERIKSADPFILYANLTFLFFLSLLPFFTAYVIEKNIDHYAVALYAVSMMVTGLSFLLLRLAIHRQLRRLGSLERQDTAERSKHLVSLALYLLAVPIAYFHAGLALLMVAVVTIIWIIPSLAAVRKKVSRFSL
jgi:TMEM175 potassium channel family protein